MPPRHQNNEKTSPLQKIIFIQRVLKFACRKPKTLLVHSLVNKEWYSTVVDYSFSLFMMPKLASIHHMPRSPLSSETESSVLASKSLLEAFVKLCHHEMYCQRVRQKQDQDHGHQGSSANSPVNSSQLMKYLRDAFEIVPRMMMPFNNNDDNSDDGIVDQSFIFTQSTRNALMKIIDEDSRPLNCDDERNLRNLLVTNQQQNKADGTLLGIPFPISQHSYVFSTTHLLPLSISAEEKLAVATETKRLRDFNKLLNWILRYSSSDDFIIMVSEFLHFLLFKQSLEDFRYLVYFFRFDHYHFALQACANKNNKKAFHLLEKHFTPLHMPFPNAMHRDHDFSLSAYGHQFRDRCFNLVQAAISANNLDLVRFFCKEDPRFMKRVLNVKQNDVLCKWVPENSAMYFSVLKRLIASSLTDVQNGREIFTFLAELYLEKKNVIKYNNNKKCSNTAFMQQVLENQEMFQGLNFSHFYFNLFYRDDVELIRFFLESEPGYLFRFLDPRVGIHFNQFVWFYKRKSNLFLMAIYMGAVNCVEYFCHWAHTQYRKEFNDMKQGDPKRADSNRFGVCLYAHPRASLTTKGHRRNSASSRDSPLHFAVKFSLSNTPQKWRANKIPKGEDQMNFDNEISLKLVNIILKYSKMEEELIGEARIQEELTRRRAATNVKNSTTTYPIYHDTPFYLMFSSLTTKQLVYETLDHRHSGPLQEAIKLGRMEVAKALVKAGNSSDYLVRNFKDGERPRVQTNTPQQMTQQCFLRNLEEMKKWTREVLNAI